MLQSQDYVLSLSRDTHFRIPKMMQNFRSIPFNGGLSLILLASVLSGCSLAPGMYFGTHESDQNAGQATTQVKPVFKRITAELIQDEQTADAQAVQNDLKPFIIPPETYKIGPGDYLSIMVWDHPELFMPASSAPSSFIAINAAMTALGSGFPVSADGEIQFPYAGNIKIDGLTEVQARDVLAQKLAKFIKNPDVTLRVSSYRSQHVYLDGEIKTPGVVAIDDIPPSLPEAISRAGGVTAIGDQSRIKITRDGKTHWVNLTQLSRNNTNPSNVILRNGDLVRVSPREESKIYVLGEVNKPGSIMMINGQMSLNMALGEAGGLNSQSADGNEVYVIRNANDTQPLVYHLDAHSPVMFALAENFELKAKDVVYVDAAPLVRLNRVISLILPTAQTITIANRGFQ